MKIKLFFLFALLFTSVNALASDNCDVTSGTDNISVSLDDIYISPNAQIGSIIASSKPVITKLNCNAPNSIVIYTETRRFNKPTNITIDTDHGECIVMKTNYPGLGIAWMSYTSELRYSYCGNNSFVPNVEDYIIPIWGYGPLGHYKASTMEDQIFLVKIGPISDGDFSYTEHFLIEERRNTHSYNKSDLSFKPSAGRLYEITLEGSAKIIVPVCTAESVTDTYNFSIMDAVDSKFQSPDEIINITCTGNMRDGTISFKPASSNGTFTQDNDNYFATSDKSVGIEVSYKVTGDSDYKVIKTSDKISVPITNSEGKIFLKYKPYIVKDSGKYPLTDKIDFNLSLKNE